MNRLSRIDLIFSFLCLCLLSFDAVGLCGSYSNSDSLKYFRDSFVKIKTSEGMVIYIDPYIVKDNADSADIVLITHEHYDHNDLTRINRKAGCRVIRSANALQGGIYQNFTIGNIQITPVPAYNGYHSKSQCVGYLVEFDGIKLYHAGDTGKIPEMAELGSLNITYALIPMDGVYTMTPEQATEAAAMIKAKHDVPIHTSPSTDPYDETTVARFASPNKLIVRPGTIIILEKNGTSVETTAEYPQHYCLEQNYPNPFNPSTVINYSIKKKSFVSLKIIDVLGKEMERIVNEEQNTGEYRIRYDGHRLSSGIYFFKLQADNFVGVKKCTLIK